MTAATVTPPAAPPGPMTLDEFIVWADRPENAGRRWEVENGVPVEMPPTRRPHGLVCWFVITALTDYVRRRGAGHVLPNDCGLIVRQLPLTLRGPDVMLFLNALALDDTRPEYVDDTPALIVEVVSPTDRIGQITRRVTQYQAMGVPMVWIVDPEERTVDVHRPGRAVEPRAGDEVIDGGAELPGFSCRAADVFALPAAPPGG